MTPMFHIVESPSYKVPVGMRELLRAGWKRACITIFDQETGDRVSSSAVYLPPATNLQALERMLELWSV